MNSHKTLDRAAMVLGAVSIISTAFVFVSGTFLLAAVVQVILLAGGIGGLIGGNASTFSLWLGLGVGLIAIGVVRGPETADEPSQVTA